MKKSLLMSLFIIACMGTISAQDDTPVVEYSQGKIIGDLPYGRHFFIEGSTKLMSPDNKATKMKVKIWKTGRETYRRKKQLPLLTNEQYNNIKSNPKNLMNEADWDAYRADNPDMFKVYINTTLQFQKEYIVEFTYYRPFNFTLSDPEKDFVLNRTVARATKYFIDNQQITDVVVRNLLNEEVSVMLQKKIAAEGNQVIVDQADIDGNLPLVNAFSLIALSDAISTIGATAQIVQLNQDDINNMQKRLATLPAGSPDIAGLQAAIAAKKDQNARDMAAAETDAGLRDKLLVIKNQLIIGRREYSFASTNAASVPDLKAIRVGTSFGGGALGLNALHRQNREFDAFGYTALKFFLLPVDKRISQPYMSDKFFINRLSILLGVSTKNDLTYKGIALNKAFSVTPLVGLSYDVSRFFSLDLGMTFFKQPSISPLLTDKSNLRVGPVIGINLDVDMFNRVSGLISGDKYKINPSN